MGTAYPTCNEREESPTMKPTLQHSIVHIDIFKLLTYSQYKSNTNNEDPVQTYKLPVENEI
jgi:hypothetical protein